MPSSKTGTFDRIAQAFPSIQLLSEEPLSKHTYFKVGGPAEVYAEVSTLEDFAALAAFCKKERIPLTVFGGGSNVLVQDKGIRGCVIKNMASRILIDGTRVRAESGAVVNQLVRKTIDQGLKGLEYFMGLPGTVGGAIVNNSHYKHQLFGDAVASVDVIDSKGDRRTLKREDVKFAYDYSILQETHDIVLSVTLALEKGDAKELQETARASTRYRSETQPIGLPSSGCMFKNVEVPPKLRGKFGGKESVSAGWLIDQAGLKGMRVGGAVVSDKHANFIINEGNATSEDILELAHIVEQHVADRFGLQLKREVFVL